MQKEMGEQDPFWSRQQGVQAMLGARAEEQAQLRGVLQEPQEWQTLSSRQKTSIQGASQQRALYKWQQQVAH